MEPRLESRGNCASRPAHAHAPQLQWSRGSRAAETRRPRSWPSLHVLRFNGAAAREPRKRGRAERRSARSCALQWSRGSRAAETGDGFDVSSSPCRFNGAAAREPRKRRSAVDDAQRCRIASMEPRLESRGNARGPRAVDDARSASMEPRLESRGNDAAQCLDVRDVAASMEPRLESRGNSAEPARRCSRRRRFNGAAAREPRKPTRRARGVAPVVASMEPRLESRGNSVSGRRRRSLPGRFNGAAAREPRKRGATAAVGAAPSSFNGAAAREPRKPRGGEDAIELRLQWSRGSRAAEACRCAALAASMEPRLESRGNRSARPSTGPWYGRFNGAAAREPRKPASPSCSSRPRSRASMEPRLESRGNRAPGQRSSRARLRFNGAAAREPRKPLDVRLRDPVGCAFRSS